MRPVLAVLGIALLAIGLGVLISPKNRELVENPAEAAAARQEKEQAEERKKEAQAAAQAVGKEFNAPRDGVITAVMTIKGKGDVEIELFPKAAPKTVARFSELIRDKFYDNTKFHRVIPDFVAQGGDPGSRKMTTEEIVAKDDGQGSTQGLGTGGSGKNIPFEASNQPNVEGTLAMGLGGPRSDTADSQFYINFKHNDQLDGGYCVFGKVSKGMEIVKQIKRGDEIEKFVLK